MNTPPHLPRDEDAPRWLLLLTVLVLMLAVGGGFIWIQSRAAVDHLVGQPPALGRQGPITEVDQILDAHTSANLIGREVTLDTARVQQVIGDYSFWIGTSANRRVPVVLFGELTNRQSPGETDVLAGQRVRIFGIVRSMREFTAFGTDPLLSEQQLQDIQRQPVFISARRVVTPDNGPHTQGARR